MPNAMEIRNTLETLGDKLNGLRSQERSSERDAEIRSTIQAIQENDALYTVEMRKAEETSGARAAFTYGEARTATAGESVVDSAEYRAFAASGGQGVAQVEVRGLLDGSLFNPKGDPQILTPQRRRLFVRDLLSVVQTGLNSVPYIRETNAVADNNGAGMVAPGTAKPEVQMRFESDDANIRKIAAWIPMTTETLADAPTLRGYVDQRLAYMLALREEDQILNGSGTAPQLRGIRNTAGLQKISGNDDRAAALGLAIGKVESADGEADGIVMNPADFWSMITSRHADAFDGQGGVSPFGALTSQVWGVPVVRTSAIEVGKSLVGAYRVGAVLLDREQTTIKVGEQHSDFFTNNKVAVLAEERVGLATHLPNAFCEVDFTKSA